MNPHALWAADFESAASAIPPHPQAIKILSLCMRIVNIKLIIYYDRV